MTAFYSIVNVVMILTVANWVTFVEGQGSCFTKFETCMNVGMPNSDTFQESINELKEGTLRLTNSLYNSSSCSAIKNSFPGASSGPYQINPAQHSDTAFEVYCDMTSQNGVGVTEIGHNIEQRTRVKGYDMPGSYSKTITYNVTMADIDDLIDTSQHCKQFIKWECYHSVIHGTSGNTIYCWWVSRQGTKMTYWGGATGHDGKCACGVTDSCAGTGNRCNCDMNDFHLRKDEGFLTDKHTLPVTQLRFGDNGDIGEYGHYTLGKLLCWG